MANANQRYADAALRHRVAVIRFTSSEIRDTLDLLERADREVVRLLRRRLAALEGRPLDVTAQRFRDLIADMRILRQEAMTELRLRTKGSMVELAKVEASFETRLIEQSIPINLELNVVSARQLRAAVTSKPFAGGSNAARTMSQWFDTLKRADARRLQDAVQMGLSLGETTDDIVRRVVGTRANQYTDGVLAMTRRNAESVVITAANHSANVARDAVFEENRDVIAGLRVVATLDGRTTLICQSRDGHVDMFGDNPVPPGATRLFPEGTRPPWHYRCRTVMIAIISADGVEQLAGTRPSVRDARTRRVREIDFRAQAADRAGDRWSDMDREQRTRAVAKVRREWSADAIGPVPADETYPTWLARQPKSFQDEVLGPVRAKLFRDGELAIDKFIDRRGNELSLAQLARLQPDAFEDAGLDPADFR